ncbi:type II toxin-antitoxin system ParD family antitoxin [Aerosakkonemataceae cyanobacterium BLCC-F154]|uniref:Type II toxin-antitoxin system ParD family antitoxin n=1 Tax=Floridaenema fluviatile BLCC-F154 TaxID=3153640 RepID=A0ABV4YJR3_9CYAN
MQITLSPEQTQILETLVKQGQYSSLEEAINTALLLLIDDLTQSDTNNNPNYLAWVEETRKKIDIAREQAQRGEVLNAEDVLAQLRDKVKKATDVTILPEQIAEREAWLCLSRHQLNNAYSQEDDYPLDAIKIANPDYAGS